LNNQPDLRSGSNSPGTGTLIYSPDADVIPLEIRIRDNCDGISEAARDKMFTPFFTTKPTGQGTGLGLSISYDIIVHKHNGQVTFETEEGSFTEFIVLLPGSLAK
jgi:signal transduction histidine kinase